MLSCDVINCSLCLFLSDVYVSSRPDTRTLVVVVVVVDAVVVLFVVVVTVNTRWLVGRLQHTAVYRVAAFSGSTLTDVGPFQFPVQRFGLWTLELTPGFYPGPGHQYGLFQKFITGSIREAQRAGIGLFKLLRGRF